jgi:signal transduction histidine kinase
MTVRGPRSIAGRLAMLSALATLVALVVAGWGIASVLERFVTQGVDQRLDAQIALLASTVDRDGRADPARLSAQRGLLAIDPDWRWSIATPTGRIGDGDLVRLSPATLRPPRPEQGPPPPPPAAGPDDAAGAPAPLDGTGDDDVRLHARRATMTTRGGPVVITVAAPRQVIARPIRAAIVPLLIALAILGVVLALATFVQLRIGLRPLRALREAVAGLRTGAIDRIDEDQPAELRPLAIELNALAADTDRALATARLSAANLAHALKTPVATLALAVRDDPAKARQVDRIDATIRHHLGRARTGAASQRSATPLAPALADLAHVVGRLHADRGIAITTSVADDLAVRVDRQDLDELAGNLIDNAARHAASRVTLNAERIDRFVALRVTDDGSGIPLPDRERAMAAGVRLDERGDGHGFGLGIVRDLATLHGGTLTLDEATGGGLLATVTLPAG